MLALKQYRNCIPIFSHSKRFDLYVNWYHQWIVYLCILAHFSSYPFAQLVRLIFHPCLFAHLVPCPGLIWSIFFLVYHGYNRKSFSLSYFDLKFMHFFSWDLEFWFIGQLSLEQWFPKWGPRTFWSPWSTFRRSAKEIWSSPYLICS